MWSSLARATCSVPGADGNWQRVDITPKDGLQIPSPREAAAQRASDIAESQRVLAEFRSTHVCPLTNKIVKGTRPCKGYVLDYRKDEQDHILPETIAWIKAESYGR